MAVRPEGADYQSRKIPPGELSIDPVADERLDRLTGRARESVADGGLISYGASIPDLTRRAGAFVVKVINGTKPFDLPIEQPTKFELIINLKTAKALSLSVPPALLVAADEVIE
jgi:putative tryptophan/tyrosine transport system substrate-binding protein